mmetsp:Transcript_13251/g.20651  ORF Transcript_13251/g.20651 Transcript_13251/m.20651 type:complete len:638 (+) Transcript_13251:129-2042(+)
MGRVRGLLFFLGLLLCLGNAFVPVQIKNNLSPSTTTVGPALDWGRTINPTSHVAPQSRWLGNGGVRRRASELDALHLGPAQQVFLAHQDVVLNGPMDYVLHAPEFWSAVAMLSVVGLLLAWEESLEFLEHKLPKALRSVVEKMAAEMGALGFIGLFLSLFVTHGSPLGHLIEEASEKYLGEGEMLMETFEFEHSAFFQVGIGFFVVCGVVVGAILSEIQKISEVSELVLDTDGDGEVSLEELADALDVKRVVVDADRSGCIHEWEVRDALRGTSAQSALDDLFSTQNQRLAQALVLKEVFSQRYALDDLLIESYFEQVYARNLRALVDLRPNTWLLAIPFLSLFGAVDIRHDAVSAFSPHAFEACGEFLTTPYIFAAAAAAQAATVAWGLFNFWKTSAIKAMLAPTLVRDAAAPGEPAVVLPARAEDPALLAAFDSSPGPIGPLERLLSGGGPVPRNLNEQLFGAAGGAGPDMYLASIKLQTWLAVAQVVFIAEQVLFRDASALLSGADLSGGGAPAAAVPVELAVFAGFAACSLATLALVPRTFLNYTFATSIGEMAQPWALRAAAADRQAEEGAARDPLLTDLERITAEFKGIAGAAQAATARRKEKDSQWKAVPMEGEDGCPIPATLPATEEKM